MRRVAFIGGALVVAALGWWLWPSSIDLPDGTAQVPVSFEQVNVRATGTQPGLTLTGTVKDAHGQPVAGADVFLAASSQSSLSAVRCGVCNEWLLSCHAHETGRSVSALLERHHGELTAALTTKSDEDGRFRFEQLAGTSFTVWGRAAGLADGIKERAAPGDPVELILPTPRALPGRVVDENGQSIATAAVRLTSRRLARVHEVTTGGDGKFLFEALGEGPFTVTATAPGKLPVMLADVEAGAAPVTLMLPRARRLEVRTLRHDEPVDAVVSLQGDHLTQQHVAKGGLAGLDALYPGEFTVSAVAGRLASVPTAVTLQGDVTRVTLKLEEGGTLAVTVVDEAGEPVPNAKLELLTRARQLIAGKRATLGELTVFGPYGGGEFQLQVTAQGFTPQVLPVKVKPGETPIEVTLARGTTISGRVIDEYGRPAGGVSVLVGPIGDQVLADTDGQFTATVPTPGLYELHAHHSDQGGGSLKVTAPAEGVALQLDPRAGVEVTVTVDGRRVEGASAMLYHQGGNFRSDRVSGADGVVLMRGLPADSYRLVATHPDFLPSTAQEVVLGEVDYLKFEAQLTPGGKVEGQVVDGDGAPVEGASISAMPRGAEVVSSDAQGRFELKPLRPGTRYVLRAAGRGLTQRARVVASAGGEPVTIRVEREPLFRGRVLGDGEPLKTFRVGDEEVTSDDGRFEVPLPVLGDRVVVSVDAPGYEPLMAERGVNADLGDFDLKRAPQVTGVVKDERGPVADAVVTCDPCDQSVLTDQEGRFSLGRPAWQREFSVIARKGRRSATQTLTDKDQAPLELTLKAGVKVYGQAYLPTGVPAAGLEIVGVHTDRGETTSAVTNSDGSYSLDAMPGLYRFMLAMPPGLATTTEPASLIAEVTGTEQRVDFGPVPGLSSLTVELTPQPGRALWLVRGDVSAVSNPPMELLRSKWAQLIYQPFQAQVTLGGLAPGRYTLVWASFHATMPAGAQVVPVDVPTSGIVKLQ